MDRVLIVEDSEDTQAAIARALDGLAEVFTCSTLAAASKAAAKGGFALVLLDVGLPDGSGFEFCVKLRSCESTAEIPIIFLTGKTEVTDKVMGLSLGADDYICKPFDPSELRARVDSKLRRARSRKGGADILVRGSLKVHSSSQRVYLKDTEIHLTPIEFKLLLQLLRAEGRVLSREQLLDTVWGNSVNVLDRTVDKHVALLRAKLGTAGEYIQTVPRTGYRFSIDEQDATGAA